MVGVSGPLLADSVRDGTRFLIGLTVAGIAGSAMLATVAVTLSLVLQHAMSFDGRLFVLAGLAVLFGLADLADRTPQLFRQVPQRLVRELSPGMLGSVWGFDLGLIVTTKKVTSLGWLAIAGAVLVRPGLVPLCVISIGLTTSLSVVLWSTRIRNDTQCLVKRRRPWMTRTRMFSGSTLLAVAVLTVGLAAG
jgi:hypothetical protein